tara:strand:+ start:101 stop:469 length:369 start_codon:yes stop_codon:yes gene_type:complete
MAIKYSTSLNLLVKQQYFCQKCKFVGQYDYEYIDFRGKLYKKPWRTKPRPKNCEMCNKKLNFGKGMGPDAYIDTYTYVWGFWITLLGGLLVFGWAMNYFFDVQVFHELTKFIFGDKYEIGEW